MMEEVAKYFYILSGSCYEKDWKTQYVHNFNWHSNNIFFVVVTKDHTKIVEKEVRLDYNK